MLLFKINKRLSLVFKGIVYKIPELFLMASALISVSCDAADSTIFARNDPQHLNLTPKIQHLTPNVTAPFLLEEGQTPQLNNTSLDIKTTKKCPHPTSPFLISTIYQTEEDKMCNVLGITNTTILNSKSDKNNYHITGKAYLKTAIVCPNGWIQLNWQIWCQ